jgi:hypothetical protein
MKMSYESKNNFIIRKEKCNLLCFYFEKIITFVRRKGRNDEREEKNTPISR